MAHPESDTAEIADRLRAAAQPFDAPAGPPPDLLAAAVDDAVVVGLGTATRAAHEISVLAHEVLRVLVERKGFRALALLDDATVVAALDEYVQGGDGDPAALLADAWVPWRTAETRAVLDWAREFNRAHPDDPLRLFGLTPEAARPAHYAQVSDFVARTAPGRLAELHAHYDPIITAHRRGEHIQRADGTHPGRPFAEHARDALALVDSLRAPAAVLDAARLIVQYHESSTAAGGRDFAAEAVAAAERIAARHDATGQRIVYWEGLSNTVVAERLTVAALAQEFPTTGYLLRERFGRGYLSVALTFHEGRLRTHLAVPAPARDFADAVLDIPDYDGYLLDLRSPTTASVHRWLHNPARLRLIVGTYRPERDADHHITGGALADWFDLLLRVRTVTPTRPLDPPPEARPA
ncbi:erythromycin esterase family protein [Nocardia blacklockiae]|uniref:erythromycin esterase family protein n=1 Tax=Nocardia blacklockiae TaxID=480036 RepID=UPI00189574D9|nr:erythromycin esterase family protein [Nocardia blacklockiae]MBF6172297.1 erythromycin esterase family protein [Nocardia blacklockiae]